MTVLYRNNRIVERFRPSSINCYHAYLNDAGCMMTLKTIDLAAPIYVLWTLLYHHDEQKQKRINGQKKDAV